MAPDHPKLRAPNTGFVVAMHARLTCGGTARNKWIIVARWSTGQCLSVGMAGDAAASATTAPVQLTPQRSLFARGEGPVFRLAGAPPKDLTLAGVFLPAVGVLQLLRQAPVLVLRGEGRCLSSNAAWRLDANQVPWLGAYVESPAP